MVDNNRLGQLYELEAALDILLDRHNFYVLSPSEGVWTVEEIPGRGVISQHQNMGSAYIAAIEAIYKPVQS